MNSCSENCLVVLVEDDDAIRSTFAEVLQSEGYDVLAFANGREALEGLDRRPCLILLDWMMPEMNGEQFLQARASSSPAGESPVVVVSAVAHWIRKIPGVSALVNKPVDIDGLLQIVRCHCHHGKPPSHPVAC